MEDPAVFKVYRYSDKGFYVEYSVGYENYKQIMGTNIIPIDGEIGGAPCNGIDQVIELIKSHLIKGISICEHTNK